MGKSEVEFCQFQELARSFFGTLNGSSSTIVFFAGAVSFVLVIVRVIRHPRAAPIISATVSGVHGRQWKSPYRALPLRVPRPPPPRLCSRQTIPLFFCLVAAEPFPGKLPRRRQYDRRRCSSVDRATTTRERKPLFSPLTPLSRSPIPLDRLPHPSAQKNRTELCRVSDKNPTRGTSSFPSTLFRSKSVGYVNRAGRGNRGEDLDPFTPPLLR